MRAFDTRLCIATSAQTRHVFLVLLELEDNAYCRNKYSILLKLLQAGKASYLVLLFLLASYLFLVLQLAIGNTPHFMDDWTFIQVTIKATGTRFGIYSSRD